MNRGYSTMSETVEPPPAPVSPSPAPEPARSSKRQTVIIVVVLAVILCIAVAGWIAQNVPADNDYSGLTPRQAVAKWAAKGGHDHGVEVDTAAGGIRALGPNPTDQQVRAACYQMYQAAQSAFAYGPIPDGEAQAYWSGALAHMESFANACINGIDDNSYSSTALAASDIANMNKQEALFAARMRQIFDRGSPTGHVQRGAVTTSAAGMVTNSLNNVLVVPNSAVIKQGGHSFVNVPGSSGQPTRKQFTPGAVGDDNTQVLGGLSEGEEVLLPQAR